ncbi:unnamed protein product [Linum tenue]|uniref:Uncharacterized protein n=1 Tax=Linum tenue TaxID=586396 RepID=A0AAV0R5N9_9ROSI|nr:unnamed protein product [Linum tenue]
MSRTLQPPLLTRNRKKKVRIRQPNRARWLPTPPPKMGMMQLRRRSRRRTPKCSSVTCRTMWIVINWLCSSSKLEL